MSADPQHTDLLKEIGRRGRKLIRQITDDSWTDQELVALLLEVSVNGHDWVKIAKCGSLARFEAVNIRDRYWQMVKQDVVTTASLFSAYDQTKHLMYHMEHMFHSDFGTGIRKPSVALSQKYPLLISVMGVYNVPKLKTSMHITRSFYVSVGLFDEAGNVVVPFLETKLSKNHNGEVIFHQVFNLGDRYMDEYVLGFQLYAHYNALPPLFVGETAIGVADFVARPNRALMLGNERGDPVLSKNLGDVTELVVGIDPHFLNPRFPRPVLSNIDPGDYPCHIMFLTRGTRGDVQPFMALAIALAEQHGYLITFCTEVKYRPYVKLHSAKLKRGHIQFRPSGGDTSKRVESKIGRWAIRTRNETLQWTMLARSEGEFFASEPAFFSWASKMRPDALVFGFNITAIATILSEALNIPLIGFLLQPTSIPSKHYPPLVPITADNLTMEEMGQQGKHKLFFRAKTFMENNPLRPELNMLRSNRGLKKYHKFRRSATWNELIEQRVPLVIPINEFTFGGHPTDWPESVHLTETIFLRTGAIPELEPNVVRFIENAKRDGRPLVAMAFSSMPISRCESLRLATMMATKCKRKPRVIALIGHHNPDQEKSDVQVLGEAKLLQERGELLELAGAPFGKLFPLMDTIIVHGGLGTTSEALRSGTPVIVTGVLLFDQRFWGQRIRDMGVGPAAVHIRQFRYVCVSLMDECLEEGGKYQQRAKEIVKQVDVPPGEDPSGASQNAAAIAYAVEHERVVFKYEDK